MASASSQSSPLKVNILGGGIAGLASALALSKYLPGNLRITVFELRQTPSTIGGAVNLTPGALRYLHQIGVLEKINTAGYGATIDEMLVYAHASGAKLASVDFTNAGGGGQGIGFGDPPYKALRIKRAELLDAQLLAVAEDSNIEVRYGYKAVRIEESPNAVTVHFADGSTSSSDVLLGCDGIHSATRTFIDPARKPIYTGISVVNGFTSLDDKSAPPPETLPWKDTAFILSRQGSFIASYYEPRRAQQFLVSIMEVPEIKSKEGWRAKGTDQDKVQSDILRRFGGGAPELGLDALIQGTSDWNFYPIYKLPPGGQWAAQRTILLGDAAHAMPPQGESVGIALADVMVFAKLASQYQSRPWPEIFRAYERKRRARIDAAYKEAISRLATAKNCGWAKQMLKEWLTPWVVWWSAKSRDASFVEDVGDLDLETAF